jgi:hypothetical protein
MKQKAKYKFRAKTMLFQTQQKYHLNKILHGTCVAPTSDVHTAVVLVLLMWKIKITVAEWPSVACCLYQIS